MGTSDQMRSAAFFFGVPVAIALLLLIGCGSGGSGTQAPAAAPAANQIAGAAQYIWFAAPSPDTNFPRYFRKTFTVNSVPAQSTLYVVGPYNFDVYVNGALVNHVLLGGPRLLHDRPVTVANVSSNLHQGLNAVAISASAGEAIAASLMSAGQGVEAPALLVSEGSWKASTTAAAGWEQTAFDDSSWNTAQALGGLEADWHRFQGNYDVRMYQWPGYQGLAAQLNHAQLDPVQVSALSQQSAILDFGKEISGRLKITSSASIPVTVHVNLGESLQEATPDLSFLSTVDIFVPPLATVPGPMTAYRYAQIAVDAPQSLSAVHVTSDVVFRDVPRKGTFQSSDATINTIWETSVYTAQLGLQATFWDAPKRDRNPFSGDMFVSARTTQAAFGSLPIVRDTLTELLRRVTASVNDFTSTDINTIPGYNAYWVLDLADEYQFSGDLTYLRGNRDNLVQVLGVMASELNGANLFDPALTPGATIFADWTLVQFGAKTVPDAVKITTFSYYNAFVAGARLLRALGEDALAGSYEQKAGAIRAAALSAYLDTTTGTFGTIMQTNAMAVFAGIADQNATSRIYDQVLSKPPQLPVSPYFNYFVLSAMAQAGHRVEALALMRQYWGGMVNLGATSFFEVYDPSCASATQYHSCLVALVNSFADQGSNRLFVSLAHAWSSGPAAWLHQQVLGINPLNPGFSSVMIRPDIAGLQWAKGTESTPNGTISVDIQPGGTAVVLDVPAAVDAWVSMPTPSGSANVSVNGSTIVGTLTENGARTMIHLPQGGHFVLQSM